MGDTFNQDLERRHSSSTPQPLQQAVSDNRCRSDVNVQQGLISNKYYRQTIEDYYKKYEYDEVPVRDSTSTDQEDKQSLTNSELDNLEYKIYKNISQELQSDRNASVTSLESNVKFFKMTVQTIFDKFYASREDFELCKKRYHDILAKKEDGTIMDMENFIKDIIQNVISSKTCISDEMTCDELDSKKSFNTNGIPCVKNQTLESNSLTSSNSGFCRMVPASLDCDSGLRSVSHATIESYKNKVYLTDSGKKGERNNSPVKEDVLNFYLLGTPCVQIKMDGHNRLSEINIQELRNPIVDGKYVKSAEDIRKHAGKKKQLRKKVEKEQYCKDGPERDIPVRISSAKKNIHLDEDFLHEREICKLGISNQTGEYEETRINCKVMSSFILEASPSQSQTEHRVSSVTTTITNMTHSNNGAGSGGDTSISSVTVKNESVTDALNVKGPSIAVTPGMTCYMIRIYKDMPTLKKNVSCELLQTYTVKPVYSLLSQLYQTVSSIIFTFVLYFNTFADSNVDTIDVLLS